MRKVTWKGLGIFVAAFLPVVATPQNTLRANYSIEGDTFRFRPGATEADLAALDQFPQLKVISIPSPPGGRPPTFVITERDFAHVANCKNLESGRRIWNKSIRRTI